MSPRQLIDAIASASDALTKAEERIASSILDDPALLAFGTATTVAEHVGTSRPTVTRFASKLGYADFSDLQEAGRAALTSQVTRPADRVRTAPGAATANLELMSNALEQLRPLLDQGVVTAIAGRLVQARAVWIYSGETSNASASALESGLSMLRADVHQLDERTMARRLVDADPSDIALISDFPRYRQSSVVAARQLHAAGVPVIAITNGPLSALAPLSDSLIDLEVSGIGPFDSSVATVALAELLVAEVARLDPTQSESRIDGVERQWQHTDTFVEPSPK